MTRVKTERVGEVSYNSMGSKMEIIRYGGASDITVRFENGYTVNNSYDSFKRGEISNPYDITESGIGYHGEGKYKTKINYKHTEQYSVWKAILQRCYDEEHRARCPSYLGCTISPEWYNFQVFAKWYDDNIYYVDGSRMNLDKDILFKHNKIYSPLTCVFAPSRINTLFTKREASRGLYPIGTYLSHRKGRKDEFKAMCRDGSTKRVDLGGFPTPELAFSAYKVYKEALIKTIANLYKLLIPNNLYLAMINYKVEITD